MHYALTTIIVAASFIAIVGGAAAGLYYYVGQVPEAPASALQGKVVEIGSFLSASQDGTVYGVSTGRCTMSSAQLEPFTLTLQLPEGPSYVPANKTALAVPGMVVSAPPAGNFSLSGGARVFGGTLNGSQAMFIMPLMKMVSVTTERELGTTVHLITLSVPSIQQGFSASGTFNIMRRTTGTENAEYARDVEMSGSATLYVDGEPATAFSVQAGDKVKVMVLYNKVQLIRTG